MELAKLKLNKFSRIRAINFPKEIDLDINLVDEKAEVIIYYIDKLEDVSDFVNLVEQSDLPSENRTIMVYKKGRKDGVNRDTIYMPFGEGKYAGYKLRAPMLCSISKELSACVMSFNK